MLGDGLYAGIFKGLDSIKKYEVNENKKIIVFTCRLADEIFILILLTMHELLHFSTL